MKVIRYLLFMLALMTSVGMKGQYNPTNPAEPGVTYTLALRTTPANAGSFNINTVTYQAPGSTIRLYAYSNSNYRFVRWETEDGLLVSSEAQFNYTMEAKNTVLTARYEYDPSNPSEPVPHSYSRIMLDCRPAGSGYFNIASGNKYEVGTSVSLRAYSNSNYRFVNWTEDGNVISSSGSFSYEVKEHDSRLVANFEYTPSSPEEPSVPKLYHKLYLKCNPEGGGYFNVSSGNSYAEGSTVSLYAYSNTYYTFKNWTSDGEVVSTSYNLSYTIPDKDVTLTANYDYNYNPSNPGEPSQPTDRYHLYGMRVNAIAGQTVSYPVYLENVPDVTGISIDVSFPEGFLVNAQNSTLTERASGQSMDVAEQEANTFRFLVRGTEPFKGANGKVLEIPVTVPDTATVGNTFAVTLSKGAIFKSDGSQTPITVHSGSLKIEQRPGELPDSPDFVVTDISVTQSDIAPGDILSLSWKVGNTGNMDATGGWNERVSLVSENGKKVSLGTFYYDTASLVVGESVSRQVDMAVSALPGIDGKVKVSVSVIPYSYSGEAAEFQGNNTTKTDNYVLTVGKRLYLTMPATTQTEGTATTIRCKLERSGVWTETETYQLEKTKGDDRLSVPSSVTIPRDQSGAYFYLSLTDNDILDEDSVFVVEASGNGYDAVSGTVTVEDDELPQIQVTASKTNVTEGETFLLSISLPRASSTPVVVSISSEAPRRFSHPATVTIPANETTASVEVTAVDNEEVELQASVAFNVSASRYQSGECIILLNDNDLPAIDMELSPMSVSESAGPAAIVAKLRRMTNTDKKVTILLSDDSGGDIYYPSRSIVLDKGVEEAQFSLGVVDNALVDGDRQVNITAAVYVSSCSCSATGTSVGVVTKTIEIIDNDGPSLTLSSSSSTLLEGSENGIMLTISRNTSTDKALSVSLSSNYDEGLSYERNVTIPAGSESVSIRVKALANSASGDDRTIVFTAESTDFAKGTCWVMLTDQTLPDAQISAISLSSTEAETGSDIEVSVTITNAGAADLPEITKTGLYISNSATPVAYLYTQQPLPAGGQVTLSKTITLPATVGRYDIHAVVNDGQAVKELLYINNTSEKISVRATAPFTATVTTDKTVYQQGEKILLNGHVAGNATAKAMVEVYVINEGLRQTVNAVTDENGDFTATYQPYSSQMGHFAIGACYPDEGLKTEMASFEIYGMKRTSNKTITCETLLGETYNGTIELANPGNLPLTGIKATVLSKPDDCRVDLDCLPTVEGGKTFDISYSIVGNAVSPGNEWEQIKIRIETAEGPSSTVTLYYYCRSPKGELKANVSTIKTTMTKGTSRDYPFFITNTGKGETGKITMSLPEWMSCATPLEMASLAQGDTATIIIRLTPTEAMQLNAPVTGTIGINCENGNGLSLSYSIKPVSEATGTLVVDVCDEYTYYTAEGSHVAGAQVLVKHPTTGTIVTEGQTDDNGLFSVQLPEGYYSISVTADKHDSYSNNILVDPGTETTEVVNLSFRAITVDWKVEETEVEDEYSIVTTVKYETNVPMPVVELSIPSSIPAKNLQPGESLIFHATLTNKGLITAKDVELDLPSGFKALSFEALTNNEPFDIAPQQGVTIPVKVTNTARQIYSVQKRLQDMDNDPCASQVGTLYFWDCGLDRKWHRYHAALQLGSCKSGDSSTGDNTGNGTYGGGGNGGGGFTVVPHTGPNGGGGPYYGSQNNQSVSREDKGCEPCQNRFLYKMTKCVVDRIPIIGDVIEIIGWKWVPEKVGDKGVDMLEESDKAGKVLKPIYGVVKKIKKWVDLWGDCIVPLFEKCNPGEIKSIAPYPIRASQEVDGTPSYIIEYQEKLRVTSDLIEAQINKITEIYGSKDWIDTDEQELSEFWDAFNDWNHGIIKSKDELKEHKPSSMSDDSFFLFISRWENTLNNVDTDNKIDVEAYAQYEQTAYESYSIMNGDGQLNDYYTNAENKVMEQLTNASNSVCASITLQLSQTMTMTRQAFRGTLTVFNGHEEKAMGNVRLNLEIRDKDGALATSHEFQINAENLEGFTGKTDLTSGWTLDANETGIATILFIPTKYAALETGKDYLFGGSLSYVDPFTDLEVTRDLYPVTLTVKPSPNLDLTYFMQRDIYGDDPLTADVIEPCQPAEFALLINNKGYGDATNVRMMTNQPEIIENEKGLLISFELLGSQLNGKDKTLALGGSVATDFGTIPAHSTTYAQWWLQSSLLGHFTDYDITATHVTSYGNEDLSLLDNVTIHDLVHGFCADDDADPKVRGFLVNDITDAEDMPDMVYFTDGREEESVTAVASIHMESRSDTEYTVTLVPSANGWNYGSTEDLTGGKQKLVSVVRQSDGKEMPTDNVWLTDRTLLDGKEPVYECRLHAVARLTGPETYLLTFEPRPETELEVEAFTGIPEEGTVLTTQLASVSVRFNKAIDEETFTTDDVVLNCQGKRMELDKAVITKASDTEFMIGLSEVTLESGYYVLTVQTADITDYEGFTGATGKSTSWKQFADGNVTVTVKASPANGGTVSPATGKVAYGTQITLKATPAEGYDFAGWMHGDETVSDKASFDYTVTSDEVFTALFAIRHFNVDITYDATRGVVENAASGIYDYGTQLDMKAVPYENYQFDGWVVDGNTLSKEASYSLTVTDDLFIMASFSEGPPPVGLLAADGHTLTLYPLPLHDRMYIGGNFDTIEKLQVIDINGTIRIWKTHLPSGSSVDVSSLPKGMYVVKAVTGSQTFLRKVIKE